MVAALSPRRAAARLRFRSPDTQRLKLRHRPSRRSAKARMSRAAWSRSSAVRSSIRRLTSVICWHRDTKTSSTPFTVIRPGGRTK